MKVLHLSDTHGLHHQIKDLPAADVIIHSGNISQAVSATCKESSWSWAERDN